MSHDEFMNDYIRQLRGSDAIKAVRDQEALLSGLARQQSVSGLVYAMNEDQRQQLVLAASGLGSLQEAANLAEHQIRAATQAHRLAALGGPTLSEWVQDSFGRSGDAVYEQVLAVHDSLRSSLLLEASISLPNYTDAISGVALSAYQDALGDVRAGDTISEYLRTGIVTELQLASASKYQSNVDRIGWMTDLAPTIGRLAALSESTIMNGALDPRTQDLLDGAIGAWSPEFDAALGRAKSLRVRRGLYRENGADSSIDLVPLKVLKAALSAPTQERGEQTNGARRVQLFAALIAESPVTEEHKTCYAIAGHLEAFLRRHINATLTAKYGSEWFFESFLEKIYKACLRRFRSKHDQGSDPSAEQLLACSVFNDLIVIVMQEYVDIVDDHAALCGNLRLIQEVRNDVAHFSAIIKYDVIRVDIAALDVVAALRNEDRDAGK